MVYLSLYEKMEKRTRGKREINKKEHVNLQRQLFSVALMSIRIVNHKCNYDGERSRPVFIFANMFSISIWANLLSCSDLRRIISCGFYGAKPPADKNGIGYNLQWSFSGILWLLFMRYRINSNIQNWRSNSSGERQSSCIASRKHFL